MFIIRNTLLMLCAAPLMAGGLFALEAPKVAADSNVCSVQVAGSTNTANQPNSRVHINAENTQASVTVTLSGSAGCTQALTLVSWEAPSSTFDQQNINSQKLHSHVTQTLGLGTHTMTVDMANCFYQIDLLTGSSPTAADGSPNYQGNLLGWAQGGTQVCVQPTPAFSCDAFHVTPSDNRVVTVDTFKQTAANGAVFSNIVVNWGDNTPVFMSSNAVGQTHQYTTDGTYTITATAHFEVNGGDKAVSGEHCAQMVSFTTTPPHSTPPPVPSQLVNTGPGDAIGVVGAVIVTGMIAHHLVLRRFARR